MSMYSKMSKTKKRNYFTNQKEESVLEETLRTVHNRDRTVQFNLIWSKDSICSLELLLDLNNWVMIMILFDLQ